MTAHALLLAAAHMSSKPMANMAAWVVIAVVLVCLVRAFLWLLGWR